MKRIEYSFKDEHGNTWDYYATDKYGHPIPNYVAWDQAGNEIGHVVEGVVVGKRDKRVWIGFVPQFEDDGERTIDYRSTGFDLPEDAMEWVAHGGRYKIERQG